MYILQIYIMYIYYIILTFLPAYVPMRPCSFLPTRLPTCLPMRLPTYPPWWAYYLVPADIYALMYLPTCVPAYLPMPMYLVPMYLPTCSSCSRLSTSNCLPPTEGNKLNLYPLKMWRLFSLMISGATTGTSFSKRSWVKKVYLPLVAKTKFADVRERILHNGGQKSHPRTPSAPRRLAMTWEAQPQQQQQQ